MNGLLAGLAGLAQPIVARVLLALGFSVVSIGGVALTAQLLKDQVLSSVGGFPVAAIQLAGLLGVWEGLGMLFGAITFAVTLWGLTKAVSIAGVVT